MLVRFFIFVTLLCIVQCNVLDEATDTKPVALIPVPANHSEQLVACNHNLDGYVPSPAIGAAHKLHFWSIPWNNARRACYDEGAQLVVINSFAERDVLFEMMRKNKVSTVWTGVHDLYEKGDWTTVTGIPLAATGFSGWRVGEPNNAFDSEHCVELTLDDGRGMNDDNCTAPRPFICKIPIPLQN